MNITIQARNTTNVLAIAQIKVTYMTYVCLEYFCLIMQMVNTPSITDHILLMITNTVKAIIRELPASHESVGVSCVVCVISFVTLTDGVADRDKRKLNYDSASQYATILLGPARGLFMFIDDLAYNCRYSLNHGHFYKNFLVCNSDCK